MYTHMFSLYMLCVYICIYIYSFSASFLPVETLPDARCHALPCRAASPCESPHVASRGDTSPSIASLREGSMSRTRDLEKLAEALERSPRCARTPESSQPGVQPVLALRDRVPRLAKYRVSVCCVQYFVDFTALDK